MNRVLQKAPLLPHPGNPPVDLLIGTYFYVNPEGVARIGYLLNGDLGNFRLPEAELSPTRRDGLWTSSCFECFIRIGNGPSYHELNFAPNGHWAAYRFSSYREGMANDPAVRAPKIELQQSSSGCVYWVEVAADWLRDPQPMHIGLSAVIEDRQGMVSYWAIRHPVGKPDFHHPDCFARTLPAPSE